MQEVQSRLSETVYRRGDDTNVSWSFTSILWRLSGEKISYYLLGSDWMTAIKYARMLILNSDWFPTGIPCCLINMGVSYQVIIPCFLIITWVRLRLILPDFVINL
jgi:hypothetical protein